MSAEAKILAEAPPKIDFREACMTIDDAVNELGRYIDDGFIKLCEIQQGDITFQFATEREYEGITVPTRVELSVIFNKGKRSQRSLTFSFFVHEDEGTPTVQLTEYRGTEMKKFIKAYDLENGEYNQLLENVLSLAKITVAERKMQRAEEKELKELRRLHRLSIRNIIRSIFR